MGGGETKCEKHESPRSSHSRCLINGTVTGTIILPTLQNFAWPHKSGNVGCSAVSQACAHELPPLEGATLCSEVIRCVTWGKVLRSAGCTGEEIRCHRYSRPTCPIRCCVLKWVPCLTFPGATTHLCAGLSTCYRGLSPVLLIRKPKSNRS